MNQEIDCIAFDFLVPSIDALFQFSTGQNGARMQEQCMQQRKFACAQEFRDIAATRFTSTEVQANLAIGKHIRRLTALAANDCP